MEVCYGIDLGTTNSEICYLVDKNPEMIKDKTGNDGVFKSIVAVDPNSREGIRFLKLVRARNLKNNTPENYIYESKRLMGRMFSDDFVRCDRLYWPFHIVEGDDHKPYYEPKTKSETVLRLSPEEVGAEVIRNMLEFCEGGQHAKVVITVPSYFNMSQIEATRRAGELAGVEVLGCIPEPVAACIAYIYKNNLKNGHYMVYDLGGGTFDCCIVYVEDGKYRVLVSDGDSHLGGSNFDNAIMNLLIKRIEEQQKVGIYHNSKKLATLKQIAEETKIALSSSDAFTVEYKLTSDGATQIYRSPFTRIDFEGLIAKDIKRTLTCMDRALSTANLTISDINEIILVGGSCRIPYVQRMISEHYERPVNPTLVDLERAVSHGAAIYASALASGKSMLFVQDENNQWTESTLANNRILFQHVNDLIDVGSEIASIPFNIYLNIGDGPLQLFRKGQTWPDKPGDDGKKVIRVVKYVAPSTSNCEVVSFKIYKEDPEDHSLAIIGRLNFSVNDKIWATQQETPSGKQDAQLVLMMIAEYDSRGHIHITVRQQGLQIMDSLDITCRDDELDDYEEKRCMKALNDLESEVCAKMFQLSRKEYTMCQNQQKAEKYRKWRENLHSVLIWLEENSVDFEITDFERRCKLVAQVEVDV